MTVIDIVKGAVHVLDGIGVGSIVSGIIGNNVKPANQLEKIGVGVASYVITSYATTKLDEYTDETIGNALGYLQSLAAESHDEEG